MATRRSGAYSDRAIVIGSKSPVVQAIASLRKKCAADAVASRWNVWDDWNVWNMGRFSRISVARQQMARIVLIKE